MSKMLENTSAGTGLENLNDDLALLDETGMDDVAALYEYLPELGLDNELDFEGLGALGAARKRRKGRKGRRVSKTTRRKLRRAAKARKRRKSGRFAGLEAKKSSKSVTGEKGLGAARKRRRKGLKKATLRRRGKRIAKKMKRSKRTGRFVGLKGLGLEGLGDDFSMGLPDYGSEGLGALGAKTRRRRGGRKARKAGRKGRRGGRRRGRKSSRRSNLGYIANVADGLAQVEVAGSMPVLGAFQYLATGPGLEALGGVALAPIVTSIAGLLVSYIPNIKQADGTLNQMGKVAAGALGAIGMWELGRAVGSAGLAKFGAFYTLGRMVETMITKPFIIDKVGPLKFFGLGTYREDDMAPIGDTVRIPDTQELVGIGDTVRVPDTATIGHVGDTVRVPDTATIGQDEEVDGFGQEMIPDTEMEGVGEDEDAEVGAEDSDLF